MLKAKKNKLCYLNPTTSFRIPIEFAAAAFRMGHSMIGPVYTLNDNTKDIPIFSSNEMKSLHGRRPIPANWTIDWRRFLKMGTYENRVQDSQEIDTLIAAPLEAIPSSQGPPKSLALLNLEKAAQLGLCSGKYVKEYLQKEKSTNCPQQIVVGDPNEEIEDYPLWYYILKESKTSTWSQGKHLGPLGAEIVSEVFVATIKADPDSFFEKKYDFSHGIGQYEVENLLDSGASFVSPLLNDSESKLKGTELSLAKLIDYAIRPFIIDIPRASGKNCQADSMIA